MNGSQPAGGALTAHRGVLAGWAILALAAAFASWAVFYQLGGYDLAPLIDLFWRTRSGQVPGVDFINTMPPLLLLAARLFAPLGLGWYELTAANIALCCAVFAALIALTPRAERSAGTCTGLAMAVAIPLVYTNYLWHSSLSQYCAGVLFLALFHTVDNPAWGRRSGLALFGAAAAVALAKQNVALPVIAAAIGFVAVLGGARRWHLVLATGGGALAGIGLAMVLIPLSPANFVAIYTAVAGRGLPTHEMVAAMRAGVTNLPAVLICLGAVAAALVVGGRARLPLRQMLLAGLFLGLSLIPIITDWDAKLNDVTLPLIVALTLAAAARRSGTQASAALVPALIAATLVIALVGGARRERTLNVGPKSFFEPEVTGRIERGYFKGLYTGDILRGVLDEMEQVHAASPQARLFFGPRLEFGYAVLGVPSPRAMPLWWHPGSSYALRDEPRVLAAFADHRFDRLVFLGEDRTRMPPALLGIIAAQYRRSAHKGYLEVYDRVPASPR